jgi:hypothetical protein
MHKMAIIEQALKGRVNLLSLMKHPIILMTKSTIDGTTVLYKSPPLFDADNNYRLTYPKKTSCW